MATTTKVRKELTSSSIQELYGTPELEELRVKYEEFGQRSSSKMSSYWRSYIEMACLLLRFIRSIREGDWNFTSPVFVTCFLGCSPMIAPTTQDTYQSTGVI